MKKPIIKLHNAETGEIIEREMNAEEFAQWEADNILRAERKQTAATKAAARQAIADRLGLTADELQVLLG